MEYLRNNDRFIDLDIIKNLTYQHIGFVNRRDRVCSFYFEGEQYYFKRISNVTSLYNELIAAELAKDFNIPCAEYDLASLGEDIGVVSKSVIKRDDIYYSMEDILEECYGLVPIKNNNLEDIWYALEKRYDNVSVFKLMNQLVSIFLFDVLIGNIDRNIGNLGIIENEEGVSFAPLFDNERMLSDTSIHYGRYTLALCYDDYFTFASKYNIEDNFLIKFINQSDKKYTKLFMEKLEIISEENILNIFERIENKIKAKIEPPIKEYILRKFSDNYSMINKVLIKTNSKKR